MLSDNTFRRIGHFQEDTSNVGIPFLRLGVKALLKSVYGFCTLWQLHCCTIHIGSVQAVCQF